MLGSERKTTTQHERRTNEQWVADLSAGGTRAERAHEDLRTFIKHGLVKVMARRGGVDDNTLDDVTQEASLRVFKKLDSFRGESRFTTWVMAIAVREAFTQRRRASCREVSLGDLKIDKDGLDWEPQSSEGAPEDRAQRQSILDVMHRVIREELTDRQRTALLAELAGMPQAVLAEKLDTNRNALYKLVHDARKRLKTGLANAGISEQEVRNSFLL